METDLLGFQLSQAAFLQVQQLLNNASKKSLKTAVADLKQVSLRTCLGDKKAVIKETKRAAHGAAAAFFFFFWVMQQPGVASEAVAGAS